MSKLNCKRAARMISLYLAGDLTDSCAREVAAHLAACADCRGLADEFSVSNSLLAQACAPPDFDAEFYSGIRNAVLSEITRNRRPARPWFFQRPWVYATSFAAVVIAFLLLLQHFGSSRRRQPQQIAGTPAVSGEPLTKHEQTANPQPSPLSPGSPQLLRGADESALKAEILPQAPFMQRRRGSRHFESGKTPGTAVTAETATNTVNEIRPDLKSVSVDPGAAQSPAAAGLAAASAATPMSRIEIQTADPNIRIIWLTPSESKEPETINHDQDQQHGKRK